MALPSLSSEARRFIVLALAMFAGFYLGLSAIISLSYLGDTKESKLPIILKFDSTFKALRQSNEKDVRLLSEMDSLSNVINLLAQDVNGMFMKISSQLNVANGERGRFNRMFQEKNKQLTAQVDQLLQQKNRLMEQFGEKERIRSMAMDQLALRFSQSEHELTARLLSDYSEDITSFALGFNLRFPLNESYYKFQRNYLLVRQLLYPIGHHLSQVLGPEKVDTFALAQALSIENTLPGISDYAVSSWNPGNITLPKPDNLGDDWGPLFSPFIQLFAKPNNTDVLLLLGMTGFGLFGSVISIYILRNSSLGPQQPSTELMLVIVRGFSAAIVVFLSIRGGIALLNKGVSNPDPLILFLFCFIGAVFSEPVWQWARNKIEDTFPPVRVISVPMTPPGGTTPQPDENKPVAAAPAGSNGAEGS